MGILSRMRAQWAAMTTVEKVDRVLDILCGIGGGAAAGAAGKILTVGCKRKLDRICLHIVMCGLGIKAGDTAKDALMTNIAKPMCDAMDTIKANSAAKEEKADE